MEDAKRTFLQVQNQNHGPVSDTDSMVFNDAFRKHTGVEGDEMLGISETQPAIDHDDGVAVKLNPWWIDFMKEEGLIKDDTGPLNQGRPILENPEYVDDNEKLQEASHNETVINIPQADEEDHSVDEETVEELKERFLAVSRTHWNYDKGLSRQLDNDALDDAERQLLRAPIDKEKDEENVLRFRQRLLSCMDAFIQVFGDHVDDFEGKTRSPLRTEATKMSPYVPVNVARRLFLVVLKRINASDDDKAREEPESAIEMPSSQCENITLLVEHILQVLFSSEMGFFRTYKVESHTGTSNRGNEGGEAKRVRTEGITDDRKRQKDTERVLYSEMYSDGIKDDNDDSALDAKDPDYPEEEIRIRSVVVELTQQLTADEKFCGFKNDWTVVFVQEVLLNGLLMDSLSQNTVSVSNVVTPTWDQRSDTTLANMYAIRYFPHFFIRSCWKTLSMPSFDLLLQYFGDTRLIRNRLVVLGIYAGVLVLERDLEALFKELCNLEDFNEELWDDFYRDVHRSIAVCLSSVLEESMRSADFLPSKTIHGIDWKTTEVKSNPSFHIERDHPQIVSICLEIGRSLHFQGVTLGKREQERILKSSNVDAVMHKSNFDDRMTELEVSAYLEAQSAFQGALKVLQRTEDAIKEKHQARIQDELERAEEDILRPQARSERIDRRLDPEQSRAMKHIDEAKVTIELFLADTFTTLAYCYEAKLSELRLALKWYNDSLALYSKHTGRSNPMVLHAMQSAGVIHMELQQWNEAFRCFSECLEIMKRKLPPGATADPRGIAPFATCAENTEMAMVLQCFGVSRAELGDHDGGFDSLSKSIDQMALTVLHEKIPHEDSSEAGSIRAPNDPFICNSLSKMVVVLFAKVSSLKAIYVRKRLAMLYDDEEEVDLGTLDEPRLAQLQVERRAIEIAKDAVTMRKTLLFGNDHNKWNAVDDQKAVDVGEVKVVKWYQRLDLMRDLLNLGKLVFRRRDYEDAIGCWEEAVKLMECVEDVASYIGNNRTSNAVKRALAELHEKRLDTLCELMHLIGTAFCRIGQNDDAISWFEKSLSLLAEKRTLFTGKGSEKGLKLVSDEDWDILDMDAGYSEYALGLSQFYKNQFNAATAHYRESLRVFEAIAARRKGRQSLPQVNGETLDQKSQSKAEERKLELDTSINTAIASVMLSLGTLYHVQQKNDRARRFLEGAIQIVHSTTHRILSAPRGGVQSFKSATGFGDLSLVVSVVRIGDAHRRIAMMTSPKSNPDQAKLAFETAIRFLESTNIETRISICVDDDARVEFVSQSEIEGMLLSCYEQLMPIISQSNDAMSARGPNWWTFSSQKQHGSKTDQIIGGLTREDLLFRLGNLSARRGNFDSSIRCFLEARELTEARLGTSEHAIIGNILFNIGNVYKKIYHGQSDKANQKAKERAIDSFLESLRIAKMTAGSDSLAAAEVMEALASVLMQEEAYNTEDPISADDDGATSFLRDAVSIRKRYRSEMNLPFAQSMQHLGLLRLRQHLQGIEKDSSRRDDKKLDEAISSLSQALQVQQTLLGSHFEVANSASGLGVALWCRSSSPHGGSHATVKEALKHLNDALVIRTAFLERLSNASKNEILDPKPRNWQKDLDGIENAHIVVLKTVENLFDIARVHASERNSEANRACLNNALELMDLWVDKLAPNSRQGRQEQSQPSIPVKARNLWKSKLYYCLGVDRFELEEYSESVTYLVKSLSYRGLAQIETFSSNELFDHFFRQDREKSKQNHAEMRPLATAVTMEKLAVAYEKTGKTDEALKTYSLCLQIYSEHFGPESPKVGGILRQLGRVYQDRHDYKRCVRALQRSLHIGDSVDGVDQVPRLEDAMAYLRLARSLMALGAYDDVALDHFQSAVGVLEDLNQINNGTGTTTVAPSKRGSTYPRDVLVCGANTYELLLEGYSSILTLLRRREDDSPDAEEVMSDTIHNIGNTQAALGQYDKALKSLNRVLKFQRETKTGAARLSIADLLFNLGNIHVELGQIGQARDCHHECHAISVEVLGNDSAELAENMVCLGNIEILDKNYRLALDWFDVALRLLQSHGDFDVAVAKCLHRKAVAHDKLGEYNKSIECFGEVLHLGRKIWGMNHVEIGNILNSVGTVHRNRGELRPAMKCYEESLRIRLNSGDKLSVANIKNNIGALFMSMDQTDDARQCYAEALRIKTEVLGADNIETSRTLFNMGQVYFADKKLSLALQFFNEALHVFKLNLGEVHSEVASCLCSIGTVYDEMSDEEQALLFFKKALNAVKGQGGAKGVRAAALHNVGIILTKRNDIDHAIRIFREALELKMSDQGIEDMSDTQFNLANVLRLNGCLHEALELHRMAMETRLHFLGREHLDVASSMFGLAQTLVDSGSHLESLTLLDECVRIRKEAFGEEHDLVADTNFLLGTVLREVGNLDASCGCLKSALKVKVGNCGESSVEVADITFKLAIVLCEMGKFDEAKAFGMRSLAIRESHDQPLGPDTIANLENLGIIAQKLDDHEGAIDLFRKAIAIKETLGGECDHDVGAILHGMANSFFELGRNEFAIRFFEDAVKRKKRTFGPKNIEVAKVLADEGRVFERIGEYERALMCYEEAVDSDSFEDNSWELGRVFMRMGITHFAVRKAEDAWDCLAEATRIFELAERTKSKGGGKAMIFRSRTKRDLHELIKCYECILRLSEANPARYNIDRSLVLPKVANILVESKEYQKASLLFQDAIILQRSLSGDTRFLVASNLHNLGNCLHHLGEYNDALTTLEDALGLFQDIPGIEGKHIADTYVSLGVIHQSRSEMHEALNCYSNALKSRRGDAGEGNLPLVSILVSLGEVLHTLGMYDASMKSCKDAMKMLEARDNSELLMVARVLACIGLVHRDRFEYDKSARCFVECIKQHEEAGGTNSAALGKALCYLALVQLMQGEHAEAESGFQRALQILKLHIGFELTNETNEVMRAATNVKILTEAVNRFFEKYHGEHLVDDAVVILVLGSILDNLAMQAEATLCYEITIKVIDDRVGCDHLVSAQAYHRIGDILFRGDDFGGAIARLRESLRIRQLKLGDKHVDTEETLKMLSRSHAALGDSEMALFYFKEVVNFRKERPSNKIDSESEADLLLRLGKLHLQQREFASALTCLKDSLRLQRQSSFNRNEQKLGETLQYMGSTLLEIRQLQEARLTLLSAIRLFERGAGNSDELTNLSFLLGRVNEEERIYDKALAWYDRSLAGLDRMSKVNQVLKAQIVSRIGLIKLAQRCYDDALRFAREAEELFLSHNGQHTIECSNCVHSQGRIHFEMKNYTSARDCFQTALQTRHEHLKVDDPDLGESFHCLGASLAELGQYREASSCLTEALRIRLVNVGNSAEVVGETQRYLGRVALHLGSTKASTEHFLEAIRIGLSLLHSKVTMTDVEFGNLMDCFDAVISMAKNDLNTSRLGKLYHQKGSVQSMHKRFKQALNSFTEAIQVYKAEYGEDDLNVANALFNVGICLKESQDYERAMKCFTRALTITTSQLGEDHVEVADTMQQIAEVYRMKGDLKGATKMCEQALQIRRFQEDEALAALLNFSGELYVSLDDDDEAERCFRECIRIRKKLHGDDHIDIARPLYSLGYVHETFKKDYRRALRCFEESLRIRIILAEDKDEETARCYLHLGTAQAVLKADAKAFFCFEKAISLCKELNNADVGIVEDAIMGQGHAFFNSGKPAEALALYQRSRDERLERTDDHEKSSKEIADIMVCEANALEKLGRQDDALSRLHEALDMYKLSVGVEHLGTAGALHRLSELHLDLGEEAEALTFAQQALTIRKNQLGKHDEATGDSYLVIGRIFLARMDLNMARSCLEAALEIFRNRRGNEHLSVGDSMFFIGCVLEYEKDWEGAISFFHASLPIRQKNLGQDHLLVAEVIFKLGTLHKKRDEFELGSDCLSECLRIRTVSMGQEDALVADTLFELAGTLKDSQKVSGKLDPSQCYVDAIRIYRQSLGESHVKVAKCLTKLGDILNSRNDTKKAGNCYEKAVAIFEVKLMANPTSEMLQDYNLERDYEAYAEALLDWARFLDTTGSDGSAMKTYRRALVLLQVVRGQDDDVIDNTLCRIANVLNRQGRSAEAVKLLEDVKERRISSVGEKHPLVADVFFMLSHVYEKRRDYTACIDALETCLRIRRATLGPFSEEVGEVIAQIGTVQSLKAEFAKAIRTWDEALAIFKKAGLLEDDKVVVDVRECQEKARHMLETTNVE